MAVEQERAFQVLGLLPGAPSDQVRKAYKRLVLQKHPDKSASSTATADFQQLQAAYDVLKHLRSPAAKRPFSEAEAGSQPEHEPQPHREAGFSGYSHDDHPEADCSEDEEEREEEDDDFGWWSGWKRGWRGEWERRGPCQYATPPDSCSGSDAFDGCSDEECGATGEEEDGGGVPEAGRAEAESGGAMPQSAEEAAEEQAQAAARAKAAQAAAAARARAAAEARAAQAKAAAAVRAAQAKAAAESAAAKAKAAAEEVASRKAAAAEKAAAEAAAAALASRRQAPLLDLQQRTQEQAQRVVSARNAHAVASKREKAGLTNLLKALGQSQVELERLSEAAEAGRVSWERLQSEAAAIWARHLPHEEREEKRFKAFQEKAVRISEAGRAISKGEQKLNSLAQGKASVRRAAVAREASRPEQAAALAQERRLAAESTASTILSRATADVQAHKEAQMQACAVAARLQEAEEQLLKLKIATAEARIQLSNPDADGAASLPESAWSDEGTLDQARHKRQQAHRALKELRERSAQKNAQQAIQAAHAMRQLDECTSGLRRYYDRMITSNELR